MTRLLRFILAATLLIVGISISVLSQTGNEGNINPSCGCPYTLNEQRFAMEEELSLYVDKHASFKGGDLALRRFENWLMQNPAKDKADSTNYNVLCRFIVEHDGSLTHIELLTHSEKQFDEEAYKIIKAMPKWNPALKEGKPVRSWVLHKLFFGYPVAQQKTTQ